MCKKIESFDTMKPYANGFTMAEADLRWEICGVPLDIFFNTNGVKNKIVSDTIEEEETLSKGTRKPSTRAERRKETAKSKNRRKRLSNYSINYIMPNSGKVKDTGLKLYFKGDKVYKRTHNYMWGEDTREPEIVLVDEDDLSDVWEEYQNNPYFPDPDPFDNYNPVETEMQDRIEYLQDLENEVYTEDIVMEALGKAIDYLADKGMSRETAAKQIVWCISHHLLNI